ncbi:MAG: hypothetical protein HY841_13275 [Bacteroidetes bacterium]|nr:hypothetical protein [Bacteroidota bacterium]
MAKRKRKQPIIVSKSEVRLSAMQKIDEMVSRTVDYGGKDRPITQKEMEEQITKCEKLNGTYNKELDASDKALNEVLAAEEKLKAMFAEVLKGAVSEFGRDSSEVEMLGGTRTSERRRPVRKPKT